uniref:EF-hand domain-containing protein n=1 Tax=Zooxanthella nutricula TaxID=1333877 RepID=A0A7S2HVB5_9DINO
MIFFVLFLFTLVASIIIVEVLARVDFDATDPEIEANIHHVRENFGSVRAALFSFFRVTTVDNWQSVVGPLVALVPLMKPFFVGYIMLCSWTMISILTAVASDSMIEATMNRKEMELQVQAEKQRNFESFLRHCFTQGDTDGNGVLDREEFEVLVKHPRVIREMQTLGATLTGDELCSMWNMLDVEEQGFLSADAFVEGISYLQDTLTTKHIMNIEGKIKRVGYRIDKALGALSEDARVVREQHWQIQELFSESEDMREWSEELLKAWEEWAKTCDSKSYLAAQAILAGDTSTHDEGQSPQKSFGKVSSYGSSFFPHRTSTTSMRASSSDNKSIKAPASPARSSPASPRTSRTSL